jgi:P27 family predicted phage terminase small subunit
MPAGMSAESKRVWRRVVRDYGHTGVLTAADSDVVRLYCDAVARYETAAKLLDESSPLLRRRNGSELVRNPLIQIVRDNAILAKSLARELGLTPASRAGLSGNASSTGDPMESFLEGAE